MTKLVGRTRTGVREEGVLYRYTEGSGGGQRRRHKRYQRSPTARRTAPSHGTRSRSPLHGSLIPSRNGSLHTQTIQGMGPTTRLYPLGTVHSPPVLRRSLTWFPHSCLPFSYQSLEEREGPVRPMGRSKRRSTEGPGDPRKRPKGSEVIRD